MQYSRQRLLSLNFLYSILQFGYNFIMVGATKKIYWKEDNGWDKPSYISAEAWFLARDIIGFLGYIKEMRLDHSIKFVIWVQE